MRPLTTWFFDGCSFSFTTYIPYDALLPSVVFSLLQLKYAPFLTRLYPILTILLATPSRQSFLPLFD